MYWTVLSSCNVSAVTCTLMAHIEICENVLLRYASECGPEGQGGAKGGYLKGHIQVPTCAPGEILKMVLSVFPTQDVIETLEKKMGQQKFYPQPLILYARRMGGKVRQKVRYGKAK